MQNASENRALLTKEQVCHKLGITMGLLEKEIVKGRIKPLKITSRIVRFDSRQIDEEYGILPPVEEVTYA